MQERARAALKVLADDPALAVAVNAEVDAFFNRFPDLQRTELTAGYIAALALDHLSAGVDSQSSPAQPETRKVA